MLWFTACVMAVVTPRLSADISLVDRLSEARAFARNFGSVDSPPPQIQTDFLPASLSNSAMVSGESGAAAAHCTSISSMAVDNSMGTLRVTGDGTASANAILSDAGAAAAAKLVVVNFTVTDLSYVYSLAGQLTGSCCFAGATAKLAAGSSMIFEVAAGKANPPSVTLSETGTLLPGNYTLSVETDATAPGAPPPVGAHSNSSAYFNFALDVAPTPTPPPPPCPFCFQAVTLSENFDKVTPPALPKTGPQRTCKALVPCGSPRIVECRARRLNRSQMLRSSMPRR